MITVSTVLTAAQAADTLISKWSAGADHDLAKKRTNKLAQKNSLLGRAVIRALLAHVTGVADWIISPGTLGKPQALSTSGVAGPLISLSHSRGFVACAVSNGISLGIDVEYWRSRNFIALANYAYGPIECEEVDRKGMSAFYRIWTIREAYAKAIGKGLLTAIDGCDLASNAPSSRFWTNESWQFFSTQLQENYSLAIATKGEENWSENSLVSFDPTSI